MRSLRPRKLIVRGKSRNFQPNQLCKVRGEGCEFCKAGELVLGDLYKKRFRKITLTVISNMRIRWRATRDHLREKRKVLNVAEHFWLTLTRVFFSIIVLKGLLARQSNRKLLLLPIFVLLIWWVFIFILKSNSNKNCQRLMQDLNWQRLLNNA